MTLSVMTRVRYRRGGASGDAPVEDQLHVVRAAHVEVLAQHFLEEAKQHLCDVAKAIYGAGTDLADTWAKARHAELDSGRLRALAAALRTQAHTTPEGLQCIRYLVGNRHRMRYPQFRA